MISLKGRVYLLFVLAAITACGGDGSRDPAAPPPTPPAPSQISIVSGDQQNGVASHQAPTTLIVEVTSATGAPVANRQIVWEPVGGGSFAAVTTNTDAQGRASAVWVFGATVGTQTVRASVVGTDLSVTFSATTDRDPAIPLPVPQIVALRYDGTTWSDPFVDSSANVRLYSVWASSPSDVFTVGGLGCTLSHFDGATWSKSPRICTDPVGIPVGVAGNSSSDVYFLQRGQKYPGPPYYPSVILHWNGVRWDSVANYAPGTPFMELRAIATRGPNDAIAVGDSYVVRYDGTTWTASSPAPGVSLRGVWEDKTSPAIFAVGDAGTILYYDGSAWTKQASSSTAQLEGVWGTSRTNVYAVGWGGTLLHYDGTSWTALSSGNNDGLMSVSGTSENSVYVVGFKGTVLHYDGLSWTPIQTPTPMMLTSVWATDKYVYIVGCSKSSSCWPSYN